MAAEAREYPAGERGELSPIDHQGQCRRASPSRRGRGGERCADRRGAAPNPGLRGVIGAAPRGEILLLPSRASRRGTRALECAILERGLRLSSSRCGDFHVALELLRQDPGLLQMGRHLITHRFPADELEHAFATARSRESIKVIVER